MASAAALHLSIARNERVDGRERDLLASVKWVVAEAHKDGEGN